MIRRVSSFTGLTLLGLAFLALETPLVKAGTWDQQTVITFSQPVEIPGAVIGPGTYVFQIANLNANRDVVQIFREDDNRLVGTALTIPAYRDARANAPVVTFEERNAKGPEAIHDWFYPGANYGHQFLYQH